MSHKLEFFAETRHSYGRTALLLSGGATFGRFHIGLIKALYEQDLMPRIICGSSVGSLIGAFICSRSIKELPQVIDVDTYIDKPQMEPQHYGDRFSKYKRYKAIKLSYFTKCCNMVSHFL